LAVAALCGIFAVAGCAGLHPWPRTLAGIGAVAVAAGSGAWAAGEVKDSTGRDSTSNALVSAGFVTVVAGLAVIAVAGGWMAGSVACQADADCADEEQCREVPAPPGGIPYKQCIPR
jgi:hypothetical protein